MVADINKLSLTSNFFAELICREEAIGELKDGILYVMTGNMPDWKESIEKVKQSIANSQVRSFWHMEYGVEGLDDTAMFTKDEGLMAYISDGVNMLMPVYTPDRSGKCYFVGNIDRPEHVEAAFGFLSVDAQKISDECSFAAFVNSVYSNPDDARKLWLQLIDYNSREILSVSRAVSFRGKTPQLKDMTPSRYTFFGSEFVKGMKSQTTDYADMVAKMREFPNIIETISKQTENEKLRKSKMDFMAICDSLSDVDKNELILELSRHVKSQSTLAEVVEKIINKQKSARLKIVTVDRSNVKTVQFTGEWCTCLEDERGKYHWLSFKNPTAHVIYIMNLLHRQNCPQTIDSLDVLKNQKAFEGIYGEIYNKKEARASFDIISCEKKELSKCYRIIENCVNIVCTSLNEAPDPYLLRVNKPLTIDSSHISIPPYLSKYEVK